MVTVRKSSDRGVSQFNWLDSQHTFSFGGYIDPRHMGFGNLRVINEDRVVGGGGFGKHSHRDMEIISYVLSGELTHQDSMGNGSVIRPGDVQRMSAGTGVAHSEMNASAEKPVHFLQIWIVPDERGMPASYEQKHFPLSERQDQWRLVGSYDGRDGSVRIYQDVNMYTTTLSKDTTLDYDTTAGRQVWLQVASGSLKLNGQQVDAGDGVAVNNLHKISVVATDDDTEVLLFDLAV
ncbi:MAG: pirin family protein [Cyanobacteria bacterium J06649_5]